MLPARSPDRPATASAAFPGAATSQDGAVSQTLLDPNREAPAREMGCSPKYCTDRGCSVSSQLGMPGEVFMPPHRKNNYDIVTKLSNITRNLVLPGV